jgi:DEAD/DEAH box helicase domain-containing protein
LHKILESLKNDNAFMSCVSHWEVIPPRKGKYRDFPKDLNEELKNTLVKKGIKKLYTHQAETYDNSRNNKNVVIVTPTASGKTLSYNLPVIQTALEDKNAKALYLFPTKALSQDQQSELNELVLDKELGVKIFTYDGDTPSSIRVSARNKGQIIITNPDMLHAGILPNHPKWIKFLNSLKYIVIDEIHTYRGVFGSHLTNLLRRLKRILNFYGSKPVFICCSATIGNPLELAKNIIEEDAVLVDNNGSPSGERHFILYNPPLVDPVQGIRRGVVLEAQKIAVKLLKQKIKTIIFARSRVRTELIASYIKDNLKNFYTDNGRIKIASYRGGYLPGERRKIEKGLREGSIHGVVSTNALELGIDIGGLDASVMAGFPGSISSAWQQAGRAGRRNNISLSVLIASASPMDQYMIMHPEYFFTRSPESGWVDPENIYILIDQLKCAVFELPFKEKEMFKKNVSDLLSFLEENGNIRNAEGKWYWSDRSYPAEKISLRTATTENIVIINTTKGKNTVIGEMDRPSAKTLIFDNAVYIHSGNQYMVKKLDLEKKICYIEESNVNYYTDSVVKTDIKILHKDRTVKHGQVNLLLGDILVRNTVAKYKKLKFKTHENIGYGDINLPEEEMHTRSTIIVFKDKLKVGKYIYDLEDRVKGAVIRMLGFVFKQVAPVFLLCDQGDLGIAERIKDPLLNDACLFIYDNYPGGSGLSEGLIYNHKKIISGCLELVEGCSCKYGCPSCTGPPESEIGDIADLKGSVITVLKYLNE